MFTSPRAQINILLVAMLVPYVCPSGIAIGSVEYALDNGTAQLVDGGIYGDEVWMNSYVTQPGGEQITSVSLSWGIKTTNGFNLGAIDGLPATVAIYSDPNNDGNPNDAVLLATASTTTTASNTGTFVTVPIQPQIVSGHFFVAALLPNAPQNRYFVPINTTSAVPGRSFEAFSDAGTISINKLPTLEPLDVSYYAPAGNFLLRATGTPSHLTTTPINKPPPSAIITLNAPSSSQLEVFNPSTGEFQSGGSVNPLLPTVVFTHGFSSGADQWNALASQWPGGVANVNLVAWNWSADAGNITQPWTLGLATSRAQNQGAALGDALVATLGSNYGKDIHFIGHSLGTLVNATAINVFNTHTGDSGNTQDTLFDDAEIANLVAGNPPASQWAVNVPTANHVAWIDNYVSAFGDLVNQSDAINVVLRQNNADIYDFHSYPQSWYQSTLSQNNTGSFGYPWSIEKGGLTVSNVPTGQYFSQNAFPFNPLSLQSVSEASAQNQILTRNIAEAPQIAVAGAYFLGGNLLNSTIQTGGQVVATLENEAATAFAGPSVGLKFILGSGTASSPSAAPSAALLSPLDSSVSTNPSYASVPISIPQNVGMMSLNFEFDGVGVGDYLALGINDTQIFAIEGAYVPDGVLENTGLIDVSAWAGRDVQFFIYDSAMSPAGTITVQDIQFDVVPEPSGLTLLLPFFLTAYRRNRRRK